MSRQGCQNPGENSNSAGFSPLALIETGSNFGRFFQVPDIELPGDRALQANLGPRFLASGSIIPASLNKHGCGQIQTPWQGGSTQ